MLLIYISKLLYFLGLHVICFYNFISRNSFSKKRGKFTYGFL